MILLLGAALQISDCKADSYPEVRGHTIEESGRTQPWPMEVSARRASTAKRRSALRTRTAGRRQTPIDDRDDLRNLPGAAFVPRGVNFKLRHRLCADQFD